MTTLGLKITGSVRRVKSIPPRGQREVQTVFGQVMGTGWLPAAIIAVSSAFRWRKVSLLRDSFLDIHPPNAPAAKAGQWPEAIKKSWKKPPKDRASTRTLCEFLSWEWLWVKNRASMRPI